MRRQKRVWRFNFSKPTRKKQMENKILTNIFVKLVLKAIRVILRRSWHKIETKEMQKKESNFFVENLNFS